MGGPSATDGKRAGSMAERIPRAGEPADELPMFPPTELAPAAPRQPKQRVRTGARRRTDANTGDSARLLTIRQVMESLQCGRTYVYALLQRGQLRAVNLGRLTRIPLSELEEFIAHKVADAQYDVCERWSRGGDRAAM
jgi:excisionase family DNA binding protein